MHQLEHLFLVGEFAERSRLLSGLTLAQATLRPDGVPHSIYDELWHLVRYQQSNLAPGSASTSDLYPTTQPEHEDQWHALVQVFLTGARTAADLEQAPDRLAAEVTPGWSLANELSCVAVHNAYHFGKIVALRQRIGAWPPKAGPTSAQ
ncbi:MAG: hypothetical protein IT454_23375 [Planctomycetes bacterium]|nr:hypothetical protein [Planctomycetota bacterium]